MKYIIGLFALAFSSSAFASVPLHCESFSIHIRPGGGIWFTQEKMEPGQDSLVPLFSQYGDEEVQVLQFLMDESDSFERDGEVYIRIKRILFKHDGRIFSLDNCPGLMGRGPAD
jgi:hypothetical protein